MKILLTFELKNQYLEKIKAMVPEAEIVSCPDKEEQQNQINNSDILVGSIDRDLLDRAENLKWIQTWSAGVDGYTQSDMVETLAEKKVKLTSTSGIHAEPIAEHVMGLAISFSRKLYKAYQLQQKREWERYRADQLAGKTMVIVGVGSIGLEIAHKAKCFKMKTIGVKRNTGEKVDFIDTLYSEEELLTALAQGDYVVVALPLTEKTQGMFGTTEFSAMKETAVFINIGRGQIVKENQLIGALKQGDIGGAGLDVFEKEPLPSDSPLYELENVLITPHIAGLHPDYNQNALDIFLINLQHFLRGEELINLVDYNLGY